MIEVYICEDDAKQLVSLTQLIENYIMIENLDMQVVQAEPTPGPLLTRLNNDQQRLYFLDIDLGDEMSGIELAQRIRSVAVDCKLVFVTTHAELALETLQHQLEPLAFILKDDPESLKAQVIQAINLARTRWQKSRPQQQQSLTFKTADQLRSVRVADILYFETAPAPHKLIVHLANAHFEIYSTVKQAVEMHDNFYRCHKSIVVNCQQVRAVNRHTQLVTLTNEEQIPCSLMGGRSLAHYLQVRVND